MPMHHITHIIAGEGCSKLSRQNKNLKYGTTTSKLMSELSISGKPPSGFPALQVVIRNEGGGSF